MATSLGSVDSVESSGVSLVSMEVSAELKLFLEKSVIVGEPGDKSTETWEMIRGFYEQSSTEASEIAKEKYIKSTEEINIAGVNVLCVKPKTFVPSHGNKKIVYIHGGAFTLGSAKHLYQVFAPVASKTGLEVIAINYNLAPEAKFPVAINQCLDVYEELLKSHNAENIVLMGDSAGGNLCIAAALEAKRKGLAVPSALVLFSPVTSAYKGPSYETNKDPRISYEASIEPAFVAYSNDKDNPLFTVLNANLSGLPPIFAQTGTRDALESDSIRLVEEVRRLGGKAELLSLFQVPHGIVEQSESIPESKFVRDVASDFIKNRLRIE